MVTCKDCEHYKPIDGKKGKCFGVGIEGDRDPKNFPKCQGKYFKSKSNK